MEQTLVEWSRDAQIMQEFLGTAYWQVLKKHLDAALEAKLARLVEAEPGEFLYWKGVYWGTKDSVELPKDIIREAGVREQYAREK